jgi:hypothetical protein
MCIDGTISHLELLYTQFSQAISWHVEGEKSVVSEALLCTTSYKGRLRVTAFLIW